MTQEFKNYLIITAIAIFLYLIYFLRPESVPFIGMDSYYFANSIFHNTALHVTGLVGTFIMSLLPKSIFGIKLIMFFFTLITLYIAYETAKLYSKKNALIYPISLLSFITFSLIFFKFEDDLFALPFLFLSLYFVVRNQVSKNKSKLLDRNIILSLGFLFISVMIWKYTVLFILVYLFLTNYHKLYILASSVFIIFWRDFLLVILPNNQIAENGIALISMQINGAVIFLLFFLYLKKSMIQENKIAIYVFSILTLLNFKIIYILTPILLLNNTKLLSNTLESSKKGLYFIWCLFLIGTIAQIIISPPYTSDYELISIAQSDEISSLKEVEYSWGIGYFAIWHGIDAKYYGSVPENEIEYKNKYFIERKGKEEVSHCEIVQEGKWFNLFDCP